MPDTAPNDLVVEALIEKLKKLRVGPGWQAPSGLEVIPIQLRRAIGVDTKQANGDQLRELERRIKQAIRDLPPDPQLYANVAFNTEKVAGDWTQRQNDLAQQTHQSTKSVVRRTDNAIQLVA